MDETISIAIDEIDDIETLVAIHGTARQIESTGHICFAIATAVSTSHAG